jgi:hypothetical protein
MGKTSPVVVADAGPIIHLDELGCLNILTDFGSVIVPEAAWLEMHRNRPLALVSANTLFVRQSRSKFEVLSLLREIPIRTTLHVRPALLAEVVANVEANAK